MIDLAEYNMARCRECGKLVRMEPGKRLCRKCAGETEPSVPTERVVEASPTLDEQETIALLAQQLGLSQETIHLALQESGVRLHGHELDGESVSRCSRCNQHPSLEGSDLCLSCHIDLYHSFGEASKALFQEMTLLRQRKHGPMEVVSSYRNMRRKTAGSHINPVVTPRVKKYS